MGDLESLAYAILIHGSHRLTYDKAVEDIVRNGLSVFIQYACCSHIRKLINFLSYLSNNFDSFLKINTEKSLIRS